jgi:hypothetical protein
MGPFAQQAATRASQYLREGPGGINFEKVLFYGALIAGGYLLYRTWRVAQSVKNAASWAAGKAGTSVANAFEWFVPFDTGENLYYAVEFPDGKRHAIPSRSLARDGSFLFNNVRYRMAVDKSIVSGVNKFAVKL